VITPELTGDTALAVSVPHDPATANLIAWYRTDR